VVSEGPAPIRAAAAADLAPRRSSLVARALVVALAALLLLGVPLVLEAQRLPHPIHVLIMICLYATLAQAWNVLGGYAGQVSLGNAVFFGTGAYTSTLLMTKLGLSPWLGMPVGMGLAVVLSLAIGYPCFRLGGHYFAIATIAVGEILQTVFINWRDVGGASGIHLPLLPEAFVNFQFHSSKLPYYYIALGMATVAFGCTAAVERSRLGYYFRAIKGDPLAARSLGVAITRYKLYAIAISAALTAMAGTFYAQYILVVDPESVFPLSLSVLICLVAVLGGVSTVWGPLLGALVLIPLSEGTRVYLAESAGGGKAVDLMVYGALIVVVAVFQPGGLMALLRAGGRRPGARGKTARLAPPGARPPAPDPASEAS
jgi:branched-chain amino acid transport system permease protein